MTTLRRTFLKTVLASSVTGSIAGCLGTENATDLRVHNQSGTAQTISLRVIRLSNENELLNETMTLDDDEAKDYPEVAGEYNCRVSVTVENGPSNERVWADSSTDSYTLHISIKATSISFQESAV